MKRKKTCPTSGMAFPRRDAGWKACVSSRRNPATKWGAPGQVRAQEFCLRPARDGVRDATRTGNNSHARTERRVKGRDGRMVRRHVHRETRGGRAVHGQGAVFEAVGGRTGRNQQTCWQGGGETGRRTFIQDVPQVAGKVVNRRRERKSQANPRPDGVRRVVNSPGEQVGI